MNTILARERTKRVYFTRTFLEGCVRQGLHRNAVVRRDMYTSALFERELDLHKQLMKMCQAETPDVPRIELDRAANIARNRLLLEALGIPQLAVKGVALQRLKSVAQRKSSRVKGLAPTRVSCRAVARKHDSLSEGNLSETLTSHLKLPSFKLARVTCERMPARTALPDVNWAADQTFCNKHDEDKGCNWCRSFEKEPEFDGRLDVAREIAHRFGAKGSVLRLSLAQILLWTSLI
jgi:hypothetical protein